VEFCERVRDIGVRTVIYTDISKDGALSGTNLDIYAVLNKIGGLNIIASGGISYLEEVKKLKEMGTYGAIIGKAVYTGKLKLEQVLETASGKEVSS
jgi:phosphoribosylformimino-5-aminoimidazole carboxamide ribotide isomerase